LQLSYEDLLKRPEENLKEVFEFLGAGAEDSIVRRCVEENNFEKVAGRPRGHENSRSFMRKGVAGDWRKVFTERDRRVYEKVARDTLLEMGYPLDGSPDRSVG
jgi:esterase/lipase